MNRVLDDPLVHAVAKDLGITPAQTLIAWAIQRNTVVLPKSVTPERIASNLQGMYAYCRFFPFFLPSEQDEKGGLRTVSFWALFDLKLTGGLVSELPKAAYDKLMGMERHFRYNNPVQWGVDVFGEA